MARAGSASPFFDRSWRRMSTRLTPAPAGRLPWQRVSLRSDGDYKLIYFGEHRPAVWAAGLPKDDREYEVDVIDAWNMTITPAKRIACPVYPRLRQRGGALSEAKPIAAFAVELPARPYQAIRIRPVRPSGALRAGRKGFAVSSVQLRDVSKSFGAVSSFGALRSTSPMANSSSWWGRRAAGNRRC